MRVMVLIVFNVIIILMVWIDIKQYHNQVTPLSIIGLVYTVLINLNNLMIAKLFKFYLISDKTLIVLLSFFAVIFLVDLFFSTIMYRTVHKVDCNRDVAFKNFRFIFVLFFIGLSAYLFQFLRLVLSYGLDIKGKNNGILGHLTSFAFVLGPLALDLAIKSKRKHRVFFTSLMNLLTVIISVLFGGKYVIFINVTYFVLFFLLKRNARFKFMKYFKASIILAFGAVGVFILTYYVKPIVTGEYQSTMRFAFQHMFYYLLGPVVANNYTILHAGEGNALWPFTVFVNIGRLVIGNSSYISALYPFLFPVYSMQNTNVSGFFGEVIYDLGYTGAFVYVVGVFFFINVVFLIYRAKGRFYLSFCYSCAIMVFLFFGNFITVSGVVLPLLLAVFMDFLSCFRFGDFHV